MADILSAIGLATQLASSCIMAINALKRFTKGVQSAESDLAEVLTRIQRAHNLLDIIRAALIEIKKSRAEEFNVIISVEGLRKTIDEILQLAKDVIRGQARPSLIRRVSWSLQKSKNSMLVERLKEHERELVDLVTTINVVAQLRSHAKLEGSIEDARARAELTDAFSDITLVDDEYDTSNGMVTRTWLGHLYNDDDQLPLEYCHLRQHLSDAAFFGNWPRLFEILEEARDQFNESWVNAIRMKPYAQADIMSFWTPLHQAVYMGAPVSVVERLINMGASRTLRTRWTEFDHLNMTALELAYNLEETDLQDVLCPIIRNTVPTDILTRLQRNFHSLIQQQMEDLVDVSKLYLPLLEPLTELHTSAVWFPIRCERPGTGYLYRLDGRDLLVRSVNILETDREVTYRLANGDIFDVTGNDMIFIE
ncbi:hypothetical protein F4777DRAFT_167691 [Nemania sp. FL0916]|nr:hypothetical protein F4777DRAFT_167691 [Nemania sp. FL0916]